MRTIEHSFMKIHPTANVQTKEIGPETIVWQNTIILPGARIGDYCNINAFCFIENAVVIGDQVTIKCGVYVWDGITIEEMVHIGPGVTFTNDLYPRSRQDFDIVRTFIKKGASIGANSTILAGITVGEYALIGAGSVLTKNVPNNTLWLGNPARQKAYVCNCGQKLDTEFHCNYCRADYKIVNELIVRK